RRPLLAFVRREAVALVVAGVVAAGLAAPLAWRYLDAAAEVGLRAYDVERLPRIASWLLLGPGNLLYGWIDHLPRFASWSRPMHHNGVGFVTLLLAAVGLFAARRRPAVLLLVAATLTVLVATLRLPNDASLWAVTRLVVPGGTAIRAVARVGALLLFPVAAGLALFFESRRGRRPVWLLAVLAVVVFAEQINVSHGYDKRFAEWKIERIAAAIDPRCEAFFAVATGVASDHELQDDAMWAALASGVPTVNGRSGAVPPGWQLERAWVASERDRARLEASLDAWLARHGVARERVCRIEIDRRGETAAWASLQRGEDEQR
ncbi:MAG: hypothetical protein AB1689_25975, partial [Thermodesulfobacteriota bacterium]